MSDSLLTKKKWLTKYVILLFFEEHVWKETDWKENMIYLKSCSNSSVAAVLVAVFWYSYDFVFLEETFAQLYYVDVTTVHYPVAAVCLILAAVETTCSSMGTGNVLADAGKWTSLQGKELCFARGEEVCAPFPPPRVSCGYLIILIGNSTAPPLTVQGPSAQCNNGFEIILSLKLIGCAAGLNRLAGHGI